MPHEQLDNLVKIGRHKPEDPSVQIDALIRTSGIVAERVHKKA